MIIEVNGRPLNLYQILYYYTRDELVDGSTNYNIYYRLTDGRIITEEFTSEADRTAKIEESLETASLGGLVQVDTYADLPETGGPGSIYITKDTGQTYYWDRTTNTYVKTGIAGRTGVYATHEDLAGQIGGSVTLNKTDLTEVVAATVDFMDGSDVIGPHFIHGIISSSTTDTVTVKTVTDFVFENFIQVATLNDLPTIAHALEEELYYVKDIEEFRVADKTNSVWKRPYDTKFTGIEQDISTLQESKQDVFQFSTMPEATVSTLGIIVQYTGTTDNNYTNGYFYKGISSTVANETVYLWENIDVQEHQDLSNYLAKDNTTPFTPSGDYNPATKKYVDDSKTEVKVQYSIIPTANADNLGKIIQYVGATNQTYTNGCFYICVSDGNTPATYSWKNIDVQNSSPYIYTGTNTADDIEAFKSIIDEYNQTGKWDLDYIIYKNTTVMSDVQIRMNEATLLSSTSYVKSYRFIFKGDYQAYNTQYNTTLYGKATVVWLNGDYSINFEVETVDNIAPLDNNLQYDRKVLTTDNTTSFTPTNDYHPATKKYVDDCTSSKLNTSKIKNTNSTTAGDVYDVRYVNSVLGDISTVLASLVTVGGGN